MSLGQTSQSQVSYTNREILWGQRFEPCIDVAHNRIQYYINYQNFNRTSPYDTPLCSARQLEQYQGQFSVADNTVLP